MSGNNLENSHANPACASRKAAARRARKNPTNFVHGPPAKRPRFAKRGRPAYPRLSRLERAIFLDAKRRENLTWPDFARRLRCPLDVLKSAFRTGPNGRGVSPDTVKRWLAVVSPSSNATVASAGALAGTIAMNGEERKEEKDGAGKSGSAVTAESRADCAGEYPRAELIIDKQVMRGRSRNPQWLLSEYNRILPFPGKGRTRSAQLTVPTPLGPRVVILETAKMGWCKDKIRPYKRNFNILVEEYREQASGQA